MNKRQKIKVTRIALVAAIALGLFFIPKVTKSGNKVGDNADIISNTTVTESESEEETKAVEETAEISSEDLQAEVTTVESPTANAEPAATPAPAATPTPTTPAATAPAPIVWGTGSVEETESAVSGPVVSDETPDASELPPIKEIPEDAETIVAAPEPAQVVVEQPSESSEAAPAETESATAPTEHQHLEVQQGNYLFVYCSEVTEAYADGFTVYRPWEDRPY